MTRVMSRWILAIVMAVSMSRVAIIAQNPAVPPVEGVPTISEKDAAKHRLWVFLFDVSSMQTADVVRARLAALRWINTSMDKDDLVSVVSIGTSLKLLQNFTTDVDSVQTAVGNVTASDPESATSGVDPDLQAQDMFNNDLRMRGIETLCRNLGSVNQKKAILFFTMTKPRVGEENHAMTRAATDACQRANTTINPVDMRTLR